MGGLAQLFHWPPSELWELEAEDFVFWSERVKEIANRGGR